MDANDGDVCDFQDDNNAEEYLRNIWHKLGIGKDGYLDINELYHVCEHIGMLEISDDIIQQLFEKLDCDQDGKVSFDEFLQGMFQHGHDSAEDNNSNNTSVTNSPQMMAKNTNDTSDLMPNENVCLYNHNIPYFISLECDENGTYEQIKAERDRLRITVGEANSRADLLAQEVDDHLAKLEISSQNKLMLLDKKYQEQIRLLKEELHRERESLVSQSYCMKTAQEQEGKLRHDMAILEQDNKRLEAEVQHLNDKCAELQRVQVEMQKELKELVFLKKKLSDLESIQGLMRDQQCQSMLQEVDFVRKKNKELQDHNDELLLQTETMRAQLSSCRERKNYYFVT